MVMASSAVFIVVSTMVMLFAETANIPGTVAVRWELFKSLKLTWNEASHFCLSRNASLIQTNTWLAMNAFGQEAVVWYGDWIVRSSRFQDMWMGLFNSEPGAHPNVWERDCGLQKDTIQAWDSIGDEPNDLDYSRCIRLYRGQTLGTVTWRTYWCSARYTVVCEHQRGQCTYTALQGKTMTSEPDAWVGGVNDVSACWDQCLELRMEEKECVLAVFQSSRGICLLTLGQSLLAVTDVPTEDLLGSTVMLRTCFTSSVDSTVSSYSYSNTDISPQPAAHSCPTEFQAAVYEDVVPSAVALVSDRPVPPPTTQQPVTSTQAQDTTEQDTTTSSTASTASSSAAREETTTADIPDTTAAAVSETTEAISDTTATVSETTEAISETTEAVSETTAEISETTSAAVVSTASTTLDNSSVASVTPTVSTERSRPETTLSAQATAYKRCACRCVVNTSLLSVSVNVATLKKENTVPAKSTSRYRRTKTSAYMARPSSDSLGAVFVGVSFALVGSFMLCDLTRGPRAAKCCRAQQENS